MCTKELYYVKKFLLQQQHHEHTTQSGSCKESSPPTMTSNTNTASKTYNRYARIEKNCSAFLIGAGARVSHPAAIPRHSLDKQSANPLDGVLKDLCWMNIFMNDRKIPVYEVMLGSQHTHQSKSNILSAFKKFFNQEPIKRFLIYYSGHGSNGTNNTSKGDWCLETSDGGETKVIFIGLKDILDLWDQMTAQRGADSCTLEDRYLLFIIADSCFSGSWVEEIKAKRPLKEIPSDTRIKYRDVHMIASCQSNETSTYSIAYGGDFTRRYITADSSKHNLRDTVAHLAKLTVQSVVQGVTFPLYMPIKGLANYYHARAHEHTPIATNEKEGFRMLLLKYDGDILPIGRGLGIASGWSWMLSGQIFHN